MANTVRKTSRAAGAKPVKVTKPATKKQVEAMVTLTPGQQGVAIRALERRIAQLEKRIGQPKK